MTRFRMAAPHTTTAAALLLPWLLASCESARAGAGRVEVSDSAGVSIVTSLAEDTPLDIAMGVSFTLGGEDDEVESFYRVHASNTGTDAAGRIYVLDRDNHRVQVFDSTGAFVRTLGREGEGPGELSWPLSLTVGPDGRARVFDIGNHGLVQFGPSGRPEEAPELPEGYNGRGMRQTATGLVIEYRDREADQNVLAVHGPSGERTAVLARLAPPEPREIRLESCGMGFSGMPPLFAPGLVWTARGGTVVVARSAEYVLDVYEGGRLVRSLRRDLPLRPATPELAAAEVGDAMRVMTTGGERVCRTDEVVEKRGFAEHVPAVAEMALAPDGTLWVRRRTVGDEPTVVDLFDAGGAYLGTLPPGSPFPLGFLPDGRILTAEKDELDVERLVVRTLEPGRAR